MDNLNVGIGLSTQKDTLRAVQDALYQAKLNLEEKDKIDLAVVFTSVDFAHPNTLKLINSLLPDVRIIGSSSAAIISNQGIFENGIIIMLLGFPQNIYFNTACVRNISQAGPFNAGKELAEKLLYGFRDVRRDLSIIFSDGLIPEGSNLINGLQSRLGKSFPLIGASASDNLRFLKTYLYANEEVLSDAACGVLLCGKLIFGFGIRHGWKPLGKPRRVTKSEKNIVYEIDNAPAVKVYEEYFNLDLERLRKELRRISIFYPIGIYLAEEKEYLLRNILSMEDNGALIFQGNVPQDSQIRLMIGTKESCLSATQEALGQVKKDLTGRQIKFAFVFNSISRYMLLGREANKELEIIKTNLGKDTPLIGIYTYGEQAPLKAATYEGQSYFHNQTITVLAIGG